MLNQDTLQGLLTLLKQNQLQNNANSNLSDLINRLVSSNSVPTQHLPPQPHPSLTLLQQPLMHSFSSVTPPPLQLSPATARQQMQMVDQNPSFNQPLSSNDGLLKAGTQGIEAMIQNLQMSLGPSPALGLESGGASNTMPQDGMSWSEARFDALAPAPGTVGISPPMQKSAVAAPPPILKKTKGLDSKLVAPNLAPPLQPVAGTTEGKEILLYRDIDEFYLTEYQCLLRQQIELFEATVEDLQASAQGRNSPIQIGQVGIRCKYCANMPIKCRSRGAVYFPRSIDGIYQVAQNLTKIHLCNSCTRVPEDLRKKLTELSKVNKRASGGKRYWIERVREIGIYEDGKAIRFKKASS
jgi:hypothetical protein